MDKKEAKRIGAWVSLLAGTCFALGGVAALYIAFVIKPETATRILLHLGHLLHRS